MIKQYRFTIGGGPVPYSDSICMDSEVWDSLSLAEQTELKTARYLTWLNCINQQTSVEEVIEEE